MLPGCADQHPLRAAHVAGDDDRLADRRGTPPALPGGPAGKARVAPLRWTHTFFCLPSTVVLLELRDVVGHVVERGPCRRSSHGRPKTSANTSRACCISSWRLQKPKLAAARIAAMYLRPSGLSTGAQASWRSGRSMPYFAGALRNAARASSQTW